MLSTLLRKAALPLVVAGAFATAAAAPAAASARSSAPTPVVAHTASCASLQFASGLENFLKQYQKKSKVVSAGPSAESLPGLTKWLGKVTTFFQWAAHQWGAIGHSAPSSVKSIYGRTTTTLNEVASDFSSANKAGKAGNLSALEKDVLRAEKHAGQFETAAAKLAKACV